MIWRACERMGIDVRTVDLSPPQLISELIAFEKIRQIEEGRRDAALRQPIL